jgi:hypothetical protein
MTVYPNRNWAICLNFPIAGNTCLRCLLILFILKSTQKTEKDTSPISIKNRRTHFHCFTREIRYIEFVSGGEKYELWLWFWIWLEKAVNLPAGDCDHFRLRRRRIWFLS